MAADKPSSKGQAWFCTTGLPSDVVIDVDDMTFHLHKFPLMSKSKKLHVLITEQETNPTARLQTRTEEDGGGGSAHGEEIEEEADEVQSCHISLQDFPGGSETFEIAAKFCYGVKIEISSSNVAPLRCAGEILEMTEIYSEENLIFKTESFLSQSVLKSVKDCIKTLNSCQQLFPLAESLGIVQRCIDSIAARASNTFPAIFGWPVTETSAKTGGSDGGLRQKITARGTGAAADSWFEELGLLSLPLFKRLILAMKTQNLSADIIENCLIFYAKRFFPGITRASRKQPSSSSIPSEDEQKELLEMITTNLPEETSRSSMAIRLYFGLLRTANILNASEACRTTLEKKIGSQLEQATLDDLLIPSYSYLNETLYDIDCIERILVYFLHGLEERSVSRIEGEDENTSVRSAALMLVGKLIDGYLSEVASDANLKPEKFYELAVALPEQGRLFDDGLYRSVDVYLKSHPWITETDREKICGVMDCQKLTLEACTHAAQNERLPLRAIVQVLFFEQLQLRHAIAGTLIASNAAPSDTERPSNIQQEEEYDSEEDEAAVVAGVIVSRGQGNRWRSTVRENQVLRLDMDSMRTRVQELERECSTMKKAIEKVGPAGNWRGSLTKKFGCKFKTQVCDSHQRTVVEARKGRIPRHQ